MYRILHIAPSLGHGGAEHQLLMNIQHLDPEKFENHVCHFGGRPVLVPDIEKAGATVHSVAASGPFAVPVKMWKLWRLIRTIKPDLVHTNNVLGEYYGGVAGRLAGVPVVGTITNTSEPNVQLVDHPHLNGFKVKTVNRLRRYLRFTHKRYIAISEHVAQSAAEVVKFNRSKIDVIFRGINSGLLRDSIGDLDELRNELKLSGRSPVLLNVGRLVPQKGQRYLIEAMPEIIKAHPDTLLLIAGVGFLEQQLRDLIDELDLNDNVRLIGRRDDVPALMQVADIFVFSSLFEGLGVSLLEASASAMAVVATDTGPIPEIVEHNETGLLVPAKDPQAISEAVIRLAGDGELKERLATAAQRRIEDKFSVERAVSSLDEFYTKMLNK